LLGSGILLTSQIQAPWQLYLTLGVVAALGMSAAFVPCNATVVRWFVQRRGLALSISTSGGSAGNFLFPPLAAALIATYGWRSTYVILGCLGLAVITLCALFMVRAPEQMGLQPDGQAPLPSIQDGPATQDGLATNEETSLELTLAQAQRTVSLWMLTAVYTMTWLVVFMPFVHIVPFAIGLGVSQVQAATIISVIGVGSLTGRLSTGTISDQLGRLPTLGLSLSLQALAFLGFYSSTGLSVLYLSAITFGFSYGGATALFPAITGDFFGRLSVGAIVGFIFGVAGSTAAFGPFIAGYIYDTMGSYETAFLLSAGLNLIGLMLLFFLKKPTSE
jgi:MFS family permease